MQTSSYRRQNDQTNCPKLHVREVPLLPEKDTGSFIREFIKSIMLEKWKQHYAMAVKKSNMCKCGQTVQMMHQLALQACFKCSNGYKSRKIRISFEQTKKLR